MYTKGTGAKWSGLERAICDRAILGCDWQRLLLPFFFLFLNSNSCIIIIVIFYFFLLLFSFSYCGDVNRSKESNIRAGLAALLIVASASCIFMQYP
jgi:hypothetical protein